MNRFAELVKEKLEKEELLFNIEEVEEENENDYDFIAISFEGRNTEEIIVVAVISESLRKVLLIVPEIYHVDVDEKSNTLVRINDLNSDHFCTSFYIGEDFSISASLELYVNEDNVAKLVLNGIRMLVDDVDNAYNAIIGSDNTEE